MEYVPQNQRDTNESKELLLTWTDWPLRRPSKMM